MSSNPLPARSFCIGTLLILLSAFHLAWANPVNVAEMIEASHPSVEFCRSAPAATVEEIDGGGCELHPLEDHLTHPGFDRHAYWVKLDLLNPGPDRLERWISAGHPRLAEVTFFSSTTTGWLRGDVGNLTPLAVRGEVERQFGVFPVVLQPGTSQRIWIRIHSDTAVSLMTRAWSPIEFLHDYQQTLFWSMSAQGGVLIAIFLSLLLFGFTRQTPYLFFCLGLTGALFNVSLSLGILQRFIWPEHWPLPSQMIAVSVLIALLGFYSFTATFLPAAVNTGRLDRLLKGSLLLSMAVLGYGIAIDFFAATQLWGYCLSLTVIFAFAKTYRAWQSGFSGTQYLSLAFIIYLGMALLRLLSIYQGNWFPAAPIIASWGIVLTTPLILLGLLDRTRQLSADLDRAQSDNLRQLNFLAGMSHELRTPLDTILGHTQLMMRRHQPPETRDGLSTIFQTARHLLHLMEHILDFSRGEAGVVRILPRPVRLSVFLRSLERNARLHAAKQHNEFALRLHGDFQQERSTTLLMDPDAMRQILDNLIANAARHTHNGLITLSVTKHPTFLAQTRLDFELSDTGEGIQPENLDRIFSPFERAFSNRHDDKGVGLGLAISRQLTRLMGGELTATSEPGRGSHFRFSITTQAVENSNVPDTDPDSALGVIGYLGPRKSILIADDEPGNRTVLAGLLTELGFLVTQAVSGANAMEAARALPDLDLVITDQFMPNGDGWSVLEGLSNAWPEVPIFLVSGGPPSPPASWPGQLQFAAHFLRPLDHDRLLQRIGDTLGLTWTDSRASEATPSDPNCPSVDRPKEISQPPAEAELRDLAHLVDTGQISAIKAWAISLAQRNPEHADFSEAVMRAAEWIDLDTLRMLSKGWR